MKYTDRISKTVYTDTTIEVSDGVHYFHTWDEDDEPEYYYKVSIQKDLRFDTLYDITITKVCDYEDEFWVSWKEITDSTLPHNLKPYFSGEKTKEEITETEFNKIKSEVLIKLNNK